MSVVFIYLLFPRLSGFLSGRVNPRGESRLVKSVGRPSLVQGARACVPLSTTFVHSRRARRRRICATRRRGSGPPTARPTPNHREARRHTTRTACSTALRQSSRGPEKGPRSPVVPNSTRSHAYPTTPCHPRADPARSRGGFWWFPLVLAPCRRPSAAVLARARACTERPQSALARAFGADWCPSRTVQRTRALRATHALAQSSAQRQRERARPPGLLLARRARAIPLSLSVFAGRVLQLKDMTAQDAHAAVVTDGRVHMRAMAQWWAAPTRRTMFARDMHARVRRQARPCQRLPWESRARVSSRPVRRQELDGCRARSTTAVKPRSRVDASRRTFCHHLHESVQCTHWPDAGPRRLNRAPSQADLALLRQVTPAGASLGETASAVPTAGWKYLASSGVTFRG
jgi:hypothetical protein